MEPQQQNWDNFCQYHAGNWHGTWTKYSPESEVIKSFRGIRSFLVSPDGSEIYHQNHYIYADGKSESKTFETRKKSLTSSLFLDNSFSWGSTKRESGEMAETFAYLYSGMWKQTSFFFETGFRYEDRRASAGASYDDSCRLQSIFVIPEHLGSSALDPTLLPANSPNGDWLGTLKTMTPDLIVSPAVATSWKQLENLAEDYFTLHCKEGVSVSCPRYIESGKQFFVAVDWLVNSALLQRGIRYFDSSGFTHFTLEVFSHN